MVIEYTCTTEEVASSTVTHCVNYNVPESDLIFQGLVIFLMVFITIIFYFKRSSV